MTPFTSLQLPEQPPTLAANFRVSDIVDLTQVVARTVLCVGVHMALSELVRLLVAGERSPVAPAPLSANTETGPT